MAEGFEDYNLQVCAGQSAEVSVSSQCDVMNLDDQTVGQQHVANAQIGSAVEHQVSSPPKMEPESHSHSQGLSLLQRTKRGETRGMRLPHPGAIPKKRPSRPPLGPKLEVSSEQLTGELQMVQTVSGLDQGENCRVEYPEPFSSPSCGERTSESLCPPKGHLQKSDTSSNQGQIYGSSYCSDTTAVPIAAMDERDCLPAENIEASELATNGETAVSKNSKVTNYETPSDFIQPPEIGLPVAQRPPTPEGCQSSQSSLVTGHQSCKTSVAVVTCKGKSGQQRGNPAEHDDVIRNDGLLQEIQKENELLHLNEMYLVQDLRIKSKECSELRAENSFVKQELQASRAECATLQQENEELRDENVSMMAGNIQVVRQIEELYQQKVQECDRLREALRVVGHPVPPFLEPDDD